MIPVDWILAGVFLALVLIVGGRLWWARRQPTPGGPGPSVKEIHGSPETPGGKTFPDRSSASPVSTDVRPAGSIGPTDFMGSTGDSPEALEADHVPSGPGPDEMPVAEFAAGSGRGLGTPSPHETMVPGDFIDSMDSAVSFEPSPHLPGAGIDHLSVHELMNLISDLGVPEEKRLAAIRRAGREHLTEVVQELIDALYEANPTISSAAAESLGTIGDPRAIEPLLAVTQQNDAKLLKQVPELGPRATGSRSPAGGTSEEAPSGDPFKFKEMTLFRVDQLPAEYLDRDGAPIPPREFVIKGLNDADHQLRGMAAKLAIGLNDQEVVGPLIDTLENKYEVESVRFLAAEALGAIQDQRATEPLLRALKDDNVAVRYSAAAALSSLSDGRVVEALIEALQDANEFVRSSVACALGRIGDATAIDALFRAVDDEDDAVRFSAADALGTMGGNQVLETLQRRMANADSKVRLALLEVLGQIDDPRSTDLLRQALRDGDSEISFKASLALMKHEHLEALDDLIAASKKLDEELMGWLGQEDTRRSVDASLDHSGTGFPAGDNAFFQSVQKGFDHRADETVEKMRMALAHPTPHVRGSAANNLGFFSPDQAFPLLLEALQDPHEIVRTPAVSSLGKLGMSEAVTHLKALVDDPSEDVRHALAKTLGEFPGSQDALFALHTLLEKDSSRQVKRAARMSLEKLTQRPSPTPAEPPPSEP